MVDEGEDSASVAATISRGRGATKSDSGEANDIVDITRDTAAESKKDEGHTRC